MFSVMFLIPIRSSLMTRFLGPVQIILELVFKLSFVIFFKIKYCNYSTKQSQSY